VTQSIVIDSTSKLYDAAGSWHRGLAEAGLRLCAVALRPDGHVAALAGVHTGANASEEANQTQAFRNSLRRSLFQ